MNDRTREALEGYRALVVVAVIVELRDGRRLDITGKDPAAAVDYLRAQGVAPADIKNTWHTLGRPRPEGPPASR
jgi:hypothetical protein